MTREEFDIILETADKDNSEEVNIMASLQLFNEHGIKTEFLMNQDNFSLYHKVSISDICDSDMELDDLLFLAENGWIKEGEHLYRFV